MGGWAAHREARRSEPKRGDGRSASNMSSVRRDLSETYEPASGPTSAPKVLGCGNFGTAKLMRRKATGELVAIKYIERGSKIDENVKRELVNHRLLTHPNIVRFIEAVVTEKHLAIVMEYASGGELFDWILRKGRFEEPEARYFFQQLISGVAYCHAKGVAHRDLKLENTLVHGERGERAPPRLKICDFGYSKNSLIDSDPKSTVGTPAYIAPEVLERKPYDGKMADVWSCGVTLFVMLCGQYPFEDKRKPRDFRSTILKIRSCDYAVPSGVRLTKGCLDLIQRIFVVDTAKRIDIPGIQAHPWFLTDLPAELVRGDFSELESVTSPTSTMSIEEIHAIVEEAKIPYGGAGRDSVEDGDHDMVTSGEYDDDDF